MRYALAVTLRAQTVEQDPETGQQRKTATARTVFGNQRTMGATSWMAQRSAGLHADAEIQVRACDYEGEPSCVIDGTEYEVERCKGTGEFVTLTLKRRLGNG